MSDTQRSPTPAVADAGDRSAARASSGSSTPLLSRQEQGIYVPHVVAKKTSLSASGTAKVRMLQLSDNTALLTGGTIARGTFGKLRIGVDVRSNRAVAIKEFGHGEVQGRDDRFFNQEVLLLEMLSFGLDFCGSYALDNKNRWGFMMTCMDGSIDKVASVARGATPHIRIDVARHTGKRIGEELMRYHAAGFLHGDVKPHNILFNGEGLICLGDHGSVVTLYGNGNCEHGTVGCTISSPEYYMGGPGNYKVDIFALGYALWKLYVPQNYFYGIGSNNRAYLSPYEHHQWLDWVTTGEAPTTTTAAVREANAYWQAFTHLDPAVAAFVLHRMFRSQVSAESVVHFFGQPQFLVPPERIRSHLRATSVRLPAHQERQRLQNAVQRFWSPMPQLFGFAGAFKKRHEHWLHSASAPRLNAMADRSYELAEKRSVTGLNGTVELVRMPASDRYYITSDQVTAYGSSSLAKIALYRDHDGPVLLREFSCQPHGARVHRGARHQLPGVPWDEHLHEEAMRRLMGESQHMSAGHRVGGAGGAVADEPRFRVFQQAYLCTLEDLACAAPAGARHKLAYRLLDEGAHALGQVHEMGHAHGRIHLGHLLFSPHTPLALAGLSKTKTLGSKPGPGGLTADTYPAPELLMGGCYSQAADIWALGVIVWQLMVPELELTDLRLHDQDLFGAAAQVQAFHLWRWWTLFVPHERKPELPKKARPNRLTKLWHAFAQQDAALAHFVLESMLCPKAERCSLAEAIRFARSSVALETTAADDDALERLASLMPVAREHQRLLDSKHELLLKHRQAGDLKTAIDAEFATIED